MFRKLAVVVLGASLLTGCAIQAPAPKPTPTPKSAAQALADFKSIAEASCAKAMSLGVVETSPGPNPFTIVMVPKEQAYKDFSAAALEGTDKYTLIYETDSFASCMAANAYSLGNGPTKVSFDPADGSYTSTEDCYAEGPCVFRYGVAGGLFATFTNQSGEAAYTQSIRYGQLTDSDWAILHKAVDEQGN